MYICLCHKLSEKDVSNFLDRGLSPADLMKQLKLGDSCQTCFMEASKRIEASFRCRSSRSKKNRP